MIVFPPKKKLSHTVDKESMDEKTSENDVKVPVAEETASELVTMLTQAIALLEGDDAAEFDAVADKLSFPIALRHKIKEAVPEYKKEGHLEKLRMAKAFIENTSSDANGNPLVDYDVLGKSLKEKVDAAKQGIADAVPGCMEGIQGFFSGLLSKLPC